MFKLVNFSHSTRKDFFLIITINEISRERDFPIHRIPLHIHMTIHNRLLDPYQDKLATYNSTVHNFYEFYCFQNILITKSKHITQ